MTAPQRLRIAWVGSPPMEVGGAPGVVTELLDGMLRQGHQLDCFLQGTARNLPERFNERENIEFIWAPANWKWNRWYSNTPLTAFVSGLWARSRAFLGLRREIARRHEEQPYDLIFQNQTIESLAVPGSVLKDTPLVVRPDTHLAGELRWQLKERRLALRCQPPYVFVVVTAIMAFRALMQGIMIRRASLLLAISTVFRDHIVHDYRFPESQTRVITNPVKLTRFEAGARPCGEPPLVLVPIRVSVRKGLEDVIALAELMRDRNLDARLRIIGGPSGWSDYTRLLDDLPAESAEYAGRIKPPDMPGELERADVVLLASKYDPCPMSVIEALTAGVPVVATTEVGSSEGLDPRVAARVPLADIEAMAAAIEESLGRLREDPAGLRALARSEAERRFDPDVVCTEITAALQELVQSRAAKR